MAQNQFSIARTSENHPWALAVTFGAIIAEKDCVPCKQFSRHVWLSRQLESTVHITKTG